MPMYKKPLLVLLCIAAIITTGVSYDYFTASSSDDIPLDVPASSASVKAETDSQLTVYVSGEVNTPGVITLPEDSRIADAIKACGDFTAAADKNNINLAQKLEDGMHVKVPALTADIPSSAAGADTSPTAPTGTAAQDKVNINTADEAQLDTLPGIGPAMAKRIIEYRTTNGKFKTIEELKNVRGIGDVKFEKMQDKVSI